MLIQLISIPTILVWGMVNYFANDIDLDTVRQKEFIELNFSTFWPWGNLHGLNICAYLDSAQNFKHFQLIASKSEHF